MSTDTANSVFLGPRKGSEIRKIDVPYDLELFRIRMIYEGSNINHNEFYRLVGSALILPNQKICGAFINAPVGGTVELIHEMWPGQQVVTTVSSNTWMADISSWTFGHHPTSTHLKKFPLGKVMLSLIHI